MEVTLVIVVFLLKGLWETEAFSVTGNVGDEVKIMCTHQNAFSNVKYFCKGKCNDNDVLITSKQDSNRKYKLEDGGNTFYVRIHDLKMDDTGTYWCGIERVGLDTYNRVDLTVKEEEATNSSNKLTEFTNQLVYIGVSLGVVVLILAMALAMFFRHRNREIRASSGKDHDMSACMYATPSAQKRHAHHDITASSANEETEDAGSSRGDCRQDMYASPTVSSDPQVQPDGLFYSTVSFTKHKGCKSSMPLTTTPTYSIIKHISAEESTVYSNV
ncbi:CMRF35-like molecule 1 [Mugil cephalus]|uniref:CMRF35-like molecule 1 n=1 Tax=Mugil cephalus TaxID=48193 RepID=UPI001FB672AD|nr:CMRF35-like molecule 1 [Mugil cephalus]